MDEKDREKLEEHCHKLWDTVWASINTLLIRKQIQVDLGSKRVEEIDLMNDIIHMAVIRLVEDGNNYLIACHNLVQDEYIEEKKEEFPSMKCCKTSMESELNQEEHE